MARTVFFCANLLQFCVFTPTKYLQTIQRSLTNSSEKWLWFWDFLEIYVFNKKTDQEAGKVVFPIRFTVFFPEPFLMYVCILLNVRHPAVNNFSLYCSCQWFRAMAEWQLKTPTNWQRKKKRYRNQTSAQDNNKMCHMIEAKAQLSDFNGERFFR